MHPESINQNRDGIYIEYPHLRLSLHLREIIWVFIAQAGTPVVSLISVRLLTHLLLPSEYGTVAIVMSYILAALTITVVPMSGPGAIFFYEWVKKGRIREFYGTLLAIYGILGGLIVMGLGVFALLQRLANLPLISSVILCGALLLCAEIIKGPVITLANTATLRREYALLSLLDGWGKLLLVLLMVTLAGKGFQPVLTAYMLNSFIVASVGWNTLFNSSQGHVSSVPLPFFSGMLLYSLLKYSWPFCGIGLANWALSVSDRALLGAMVSAHDAGIYTASYQIASIIPMALYSFFGALIWPVIYQRYAWAPTQAVILIGKSFGYLLWLIVPFTLLAILGKHVLLGVFVGQGYETGSSIILWVAPAFALIGLNSITAMPFWLMDRSLMYLIITAGSAACNILLNLIFIPKVGFQAAAVSTFVAYLMLFVASILIGRQAMKWTISPVHLYATAIGTVVGVVFFIVLGHAGSLMNMGLFFVAYFSSSIALLLMIDETSRLRVLNAFSRLSAWDKSLDPPH